MNILIKGAMFKDLLKALPEKERQVIQEEHRWGVSDSEKLRIDIAEFSDDALDIFYKFLDERAAGGTDRSAAISRGQVKQWMDIKRDPSGMKVSKLENLPSALKKYVADNAPHRYLFQQMSDGNSVPYFVDNISYSMATEYSPAQVHVSLAGVCSAMGKGFNGERSSRRGGSTECITIYHADMAGKVLSRILSDMGWYVETPERMEAYGKEMEKFVALRGRVGLQMSVSGKAFPRESGWRRGDFSTVERDGRAAKMVIDAEKGEALCTKFDCDFWEAKEGKDEREAKIWSIPVHPYLRMFDLEEHGFYAVHVNNTDPYVYDTKMGEKLVLPSDVKELLGILIEHASSSFKDIIDGKAGGAIVLCQGEPGTGKTLTAEVYSEVMKRPLYKVQSHQLGLSVQHLEENLKEVLGRAERWGAILLLDEADVYVRTRANDLEQNAIVGVFLRVLEYYRGVLFMTTNRGTELDDAIISRVTARIEYKNPDEDDSRDIWSIISHENGIDLELSEIDKLVKELSVSGRDIKNLLKLAKMLADGRGIKVTAELIKTVRKFKQ